MIEGERIVRMRSHLGRHRDRHRFDREEVILLDVMQALCVVILSESHVKRTLTSDTMILQTLKICVQYNTISISFCR